MKTVINLSVRVAEFAPLSSAAANSLTRITRPYRIGWHAYALHLVSGGLSLEVVGRLLGHTSPETTKRYAHLADDPLRRATEIFGAKIGKSNAR
jgi:site-specific recombinase XerD